MGFWDFIDDAKRELAWKAESLVDSVKDVASDIADGTMKEKITDFRDEWKDNFAELKEIMAEKDPEAPTLKDLGALAIKEIKENPLKGGAIAAAVVAAPVLAVGAAGAGLAFLGQAAIAATATKLVEEIKSDSKILSECNKVKAATEAAITANYKKELDTLRRIAEDHNEITAAMICTYLGGQAFWNECKQGEAISDDQYNNLLFIVAGVSDKIIPKYCKVIFEEYKTKIITVEEAKNILLSEEFGYEESLVNDCFAEVFKIIKDIITGDSDVNEN